MLTFLRKIKEALAVDDNKNIVRKGGMQPPNAAPPPQAATTPPGRPPAPPRSSGGGSRDLDFTDREHPPPVTWLVKWCPHMERWSPCNVGMGCGCSWSNPEEHGPVAYNGVIQPLGTLTHGIHF